MSTDAAPPTFVVEKKRKRHWLPWPLRYALYLTVLIGVLLLAVQLVLISPLPRRIAQDQATKILGLRVELDSVHVTWGGTTTLRNLRVSLPLADKPMLVAPSVVAKHTNLFSILFGLEIERIDVDKPTIDLRQDASGRWNAQDALARVTAAPQQETAAKPASNNVPRLPSIKVHDAVITASFNDGQQIKLEPLVVDTDGSDALVYRYKAGLPEHATVEGTLLPGKDWSHHVAFFLGNLKPILGKLGKDLPDNAEVRGRWDGALAADGLRGSLALDRAVFGEIDVAASVRLGTGGGLAVDSNAVNVTTGSGPIQQLRITGGSVRLDGPVISVSGLKLSTLSGYASIDAAVDYTTLTGSLGATFDQFKYATAVVSGKLGARVDKSMSNGPVFETTVDLTRLSLGNRNYSGSTRLTGSGANWQNMDWALVASKVTLEGGGPYAQGRELQAKITNRRNEAGETVIRLSDLNTPGDIQIAGIGGITLSPTAEPRWFFWSTGRELPVHVPKVGWVNLLYNLNAHGRGGQATLKEIYAKLGDLQLSGAGTYGPENPATPLNLKLILQQISALEGANLTEAFIRGSFWSEATVSGTVSPLALRLDAETSADNLVFGDLHIGNVRAIIEGHATPDGLTLHSERIGLLGGEWKVDGVWPTDDKADVTLDVGVDQLPLANVGRLMETPPLTGAVDVKIAARMPEADRRKLTVDGSISGKSLGLEQYVLDELLLPLTVRGGDITVAPVASLGSGTAAITFNTKLDDNRGRINTKIVIKDWPAMPVVVDPAVAAASPIGEISTTGPATASSQPATEPTTRPERGADALVTIYTPENLEIRPRTPGPNNTQLLTATGIVKVYIAGRLHDKNLADLSCELGFDRRTIAVRDFGGTLAGGQIAGGAWIDIDAPLTGYGEVKLTGLLADRFIELVPAAKGLRGRFDALLKLTPTTGDRALGKVRLDANLFAFDAAYETVGLGNSYLVGYFDKADDTKLPIDRFVTNEARITVADGAIRPFVRLSLREGSVWTQVAVTLEALDLAQLAGVVKSEKPLEVAGLLSGRINGFGNLSNVKELIADGDVSVSRGDLTRVPIIADIFELARGIGLGKKEPAGTASARFRYENDTARLLHAEAFDRGLYVEGFNVVLAGVSDWPKTTLSGYALATGRPLKDIKIPIIGDLFGDADEILSAVQKEATTIRLSGTIEKYKVELAAINEVFGEIKNIFGG